jgi:hypothetical protein
MLRNKQTSWPKQAAIVVSSSPNMHMLLREMLRTYQWTVIDTIPSVKKAMLAVKESMANLIIVDDSMEAPAISHLRYLLSDPVSLTTPVLSFVSEFNDTEEAHIQQMGLPATVEKPLTPSSFLPAFTNTIRQWEKPEFVLLRNAGYLIKSGNTIEGFKILLRCRENKATRILATEACALLLRKSGKVKEAESMLISALKVSKNIGIIISLADLYMHASMPNLAHRLLFGATNTFNKTVAFYPDLMQAALMKGCTDLAIEYLYHMKMLDYMPEQTAMFLARILYSEGRVVEAESILYNNRTSFKKLKQHWNSAENERLDVAG